MSDVSEHPLVEILVRHDATRGVLVRQRILDRVRRTLVLVAGEGRAAGWIETEFLGWGKRRHFDLPCTEMLVDRCVERFAGLGVAAGRVVGCGTEDLGKADLVVVVQGAGVAAGVLRWCPGGEVDQRDEVITQALNLVAVGFDEVLMDPDCIEGAIEVSYRAIGAQLRAMERGEAVVEEEGAGAFDPGI